MKDRERVHAEVREYLLELFPEEDPASLTDDTRLVSSGVLDSISLIQLVAHLEETYDVKIEAHEMSADFLDTSSMIATLVHDKLEPGAR